MNDHQESGKSAAVQSSTDLDALTETVIGCAYRVHNTLGPGFLEKVYENALGIELREQGIEAIAQAPVNVFYRNQPVGEFYADLLIPGRLIVELKAVNDIAKEHEVQVVNYLAASGIDHGLLINFGPSVQVKRKYREYRKRE